MEYAGPLINVLPSHRKYICVSLILQKPEIKPAIA